MITNQLKYYVLMKIKMSTDCDTSGLVQQQKALSQSDIREALEKKILSFTAASTYEALPNLLVTERGITFTQLPPKEFDPNNPVATCCVLVIDFDGANPSPEKGNYLVSDSKRDYTQFFDLIYDLTNWMVVKLFISDGSQEGEQKIVKYLVVSPQAKMGEFCHEVTSLLKIMQGGVVDDKYNSFAFIIKSNMHTDDRM